MKHKAQSRQRKQRSLNYSRLEPRQLLTADFSLALGGTVLTLDDFFSPFSSGAVARIFGGQ